MDRQALNRPVIAEFRAGGGVLSGQLASTSMLLLTTIGVRSGEPRTTPPACAPDGDAVVVFASNLGAPRDPDRPIPHVVLHGKEA